MRLSDLLDCRVFDVAGEEVGHVHDAGLVQDGAPIGPVGAAFRVHSLVVGPRALSTRLGLDARTTHGPAPLTWWARRLGPPVVVPWGAIAHFEEERITLSVRGDALERVAFAEERA